MAILAGRDPGPLVIFVRWRTVERGFNRLKQWRGVTTRYDKYALTYLAGVLLACTVIHSRLGTKELRDTP
jgi:hypothetical protein